MSHVITRYTHHHTSPLFALFAGADKEGSVATKASAVPLRVIAVAADILVI